MSDNTIAPAPKIAPHSKESEMMVLGCMLTSVNSLNLAADALDDSDFYFTEHKILFQALKSAYKNDKPADVHLICEELKRIDKLKAVGGVSYVTTLAQYAGTSAYIEEYTDIVKNKSILRRMIFASQEIEKSALENPKDVASVLDDAQQKFFIISQAANPFAGVLIKDLLLGIKTESKLSFLKELEARQAHFLEKGSSEVEVTGLPTHFLDLDKLLNGFSPSNLMILAARPAMGKTALALNIAENICFKNNIPVGVFSLEMSAEQLLHRMICSQSEVESDKMKKGSLTGLEYQRIVASVNMMQQYTMIIDDQPGLKITDLRARARRMKESYGIAFLVIDYLQLLSGTGFYKNAENRQNEISEISRLLKNLARELNIPVLCLSQLSRKVEERQGHRPMMSDLRESGCLAADTLITDAISGKRFTIKELAERKEQVPIHIQAINPTDWKEGIYPMTRVFYSGKKKIYELKTRTGKTIKASANHPFLKLNQWVSLDQLKVGDKIATPRAASSQASSSSLSKQELTLLAHLIGDGCILPRQPYHYTSGDLQNIHTVKVAAEDLFSIQGRIVPQKNWHHLYLPSPQHLTHKIKHPITNWFDHLGIQRCRSYEKRLPSALFACDNEHLAIFLHHLWSTDGNISSKVLKGRKPAAAIYYASSSKTLAEQVQHLLLRFEIQASLRVQTSKKEYRKMYHVHIEGSAQQQRFLQQIGSAGKRGEITPYLLENLQQIKANTNYDVIPKEAWSLYIEKEKNKLGLSWRDLFQLSNKSFAGGVVKKGISRNRMKELYQHLPSKDLFHLANSDVYWDEITTITELGIEDVYDATVPGVHNFLANDIFVHNSIEQDADIVMFLLRREYYDPYDKPGLAELIIAKNRHGGVGTINLAYRKEIAQFANYVALSSSTLPDNEEAFSAFSPKK